MFKIPTTIPQDLLLIQELVSKEETIGTTTGTSLSDIASSDDSSCASTETDSEDEDEIDASLPVILNTDAQEILKEDSELVPSPSEDSDSDSESDEDDIVASREVPARLGLSDGEEDDEGAASIVNHAAIVKTKNEVEDASISVPDIQEVGKDERLELVGEVLSIFENLVIIKGNASEVAFKASERALDSDSLLVFDDRKVLGFVHETFGPTSQPFYQVKFPSSTPVDSASVKVGRTVFHLPERSKFVFPSQLKLEKGSDASNFYDEEVPMDEIEFSDDEAEAAFKRRQKNRHSDRRSASVASSRFSTPVPSQMRDQELMDDTMYNASPYDEYGPYNMELEPGPSRPAPLPYDDPYQEVPRLSETPTSASTVSEGRSHGRYSNESSRDHTRDSPRGRGRGRGRGRDNTRGRGRDNAQRGRGRGRSERQFGAQDASMRGRSSNHERPEALPPRSLSPTSLAIARATGQYSDGATFQDPGLSVAATLAPTSPWDANNSSGQYSAPPQSYYGQTYGQTYTQPHINPRFASMLGINMNFMQQQQQQYSPFQPSVLPSGAPAMNGWSANGGWNAPGTSGVDDYAVKVENTDGTEGP